MRRLWTRLDTVLRTYALTDTPFLYRNPAYPHGVPVTARLRDGRVDLAVHTGQSLHGVEIVAERRCRLTEDDDCVICWLGLPPGITPAGLRALFKDGPCHVALRRLTLLARHLEDDDDRDDILDELESFRIEIEGHLALLTEDGVLCHAVPSPAAVSQGSVRSRGLLHASHWTANRTAVSAGAVRSLMNACQFADYSGRWAGGRL